ncbi:hypothetical protein OE88DRAFT_1739563 [Heliocybe sulcata]|uniref:Uncharacterized protein n=1 Tax=Heliocybe sulcata TaxID=5364 RepID=A0A5C3MLV9_9AGAM|nr:hypothetical protein OE88DRAFT_1739563 [Heliocybe sulcata]
MDLPPKSSSLPRAPQKLQYKFPKPPLQLPTATASQPAAMKVCSGCHKPRITPSDPYKTCKKCRDKEKEKRKRRAERDAAAASLVPNRKPAPTPPTGIGRKPLLEVRDLSRAGLADFGKVKGEMVVKREETKKVVVGVKREAGADDGLPRFMKRPKLEPHARVPFHAPPLDDFAPTSYQSSTSLIHAIPSLRSVAFTGVYSIVANPTTSHSRRVHKVYKELKRELKPSWTFGASSTVIDSNPYIHRAQFPCTCTAAVPTRPQPSKPKNLMGYFSSSPSPLEDNDAGKCAGYLRITVSDDDSHWLPIKGQKVVVQVEHP